MTQQAAPHPRMHGLTHVTGGPDPIPGLLPFAADYPGLVLQHPCLIHYWPCDETSGDLVDRKGSWPLAPDFTTVLGSTYPQYGAPGPVAGQTAVFNAGVGGIGGNDGRFFYTETTPVTLDEYTIEMWLWLAGYAATGASTLLEVEAASFYVFGETLTENLVFTSGGSTLADPAVLPLDQWHHIVGRYDGTTLDLWRNGHIVASDGSVGDVDLDVGPVTWLNHPGPSWAPLNGTAAHLALYDCALSDADIINHFNMVADADGGAGGVGNVLTLDEDGNPVWAPPGVEVTHGDGEPDDTPVGAPGGSGATSVSGWHLNVHVETAVLYDSSPARFDVPSRAWTRVPFNTVRIQRTWETTVGGPGQSAWLPDDRGLAEHARNGVLHVAAGMAATPDPINGNCVIDAWYAIEYPVLDWQGLPDYTGDPLLDAPDFYTRSARILNLSSGVVLRREPGSDRRRFVEWEFLDDADGMPVSVAYSADNPYPNYPVWAARPLTLPQPYPQLSPTDSLAYYTTAAGNPGFDGANFQLAPNVAAGDNVCLQAWQDSPWLIRFSTDHFPNYRPFGLAEPWRQRPYLAVTYRYDPETIDHTTGRML